MNTTFLKSALLATAAIAVGAMVSPTVARTLTYTFANTSGVAYCDGITLTDTSGAYAGTHTGSCLSSNDPAGGFTAKIGGKFIEAGTTYDGVAPEYTFYLDTRGMAWYLYSAEGTTWTEINDGVLLKGAPPASQKGSKNTSRNAGAHVPKDHISPY